MLKVIKTFRDGSKLEYDTGRFDDWCVYLVNGNDFSKHAPKDVEYFALLQDYSKKYGKERIYQDFVQIYNCTHKDVEDEVLEKISQIADAYNEEDKLVIEKIFSILYLAMIAEERKAYTKLGERIKRLGVYLALIVGEPAKEAANCMKGKNWREIDSMCQKYGF